MKAFKKVITLTLCVIFSINCSTISRAAETVVTETGDYQVIAEDGTDLDSVMKLGDSRAYLINKITKVTISPAYYNETEKQWHYYSSRMVTYTPKDTDSTQNVSVPYSSSIWSGLDTTHVRVRVYFDKQNSGQVTPYQDNVKLDPIEYNSGSCYYTYYYIPRRTHVTRNLQLYFDSGAYNMLNINTYVKEWR